MGMRALMIGFALVLAVPLVGCAGGSEAQAPARTVVSIAADGQTHRFDVEVARSEEAQQKGLMFRTELPKDGGMLFPFAKPKIASFWMKNTLIPLDMIFIRSDGSIDSIAENTIPDSLEPVVSGGEVAAEIGRVSVRNRRGRDVWIAVGAD